MSTIPTFDSTSYGLTRHLRGVPYADAVERTRAELSKEGFGVLTEIDVKATMKKKVDADTRDYVILGACNPPIAHQALQAEPAIGLLLPCNVVVAADDDGGAIVSAIDPVAMFALVNRDDVAPIANEVKQRLTRVLDALAS